jgi:DNA invertase Pin-like site-specific DNA recombinase
MHIAYVRVRTGEQKLDLQLDALDAADCEKTYTETISGRASSRPKLDTCLGQLREGDLLVLPCLKRFDGPKALYRYVGPLGQTRT